MDIAQCPVTVEELKKQLRITTDDFNSQLEVNLLAAAEWCEHYSGREIGSFEDFPKSLHVAILLYAAELFENPIDHVSERTTAAQRLADPLIWQETTT